MSSIVNNHKILPPVITFVLLYHIDGFAHEFEVGILAGDEPALRVESIIYEDFLQVIELPLHLLMSDRNNF